MGLDRLCFGTSTFVAGRLCPDKDSGPGMAALRAAILAGVRLVHSNPKLLTQWAIREVLDRSEHAAAVRHLIKVEAPVGADYTTLTAEIEAAAEVSRQRLGVERLHALVLEIDVKRSASTSLVDPLATRSFYLRGVRATRAIGGVDHVLAYCHQSVQLAAALSCPQVAGVAAQYHQAAPWAGRHLSAIGSRGKIFIGMSPLARGALVKYDAVPCDRLAALRWALANRQVSAVAITMSSVEHFREVAATVGHPNSVTAAQID